MATLASTNVSGSFSPNGEQPMMWGDSGLYVEVFRCASGAVADTVAITPRWIGTIYTVMSGTSATSNAVTTGTTNVTLTLQASAATTTTFDVWIIGRRAT